MSKRNSKRWVYLIGSTVAGPVKIGVANNPEARLAKLQTGSPQPLLLLWKTRGGQALESALHAYFAPYRLHGEWFDFGDENPAALVATAAVLMGYRAQPERIPEPARYRFSDCTSCASARVHSAPAPVMPTPRVAKPPEPASEEQVLAALAAGVDQVPALVERTGLSRPTVYRALEKLQRLGKAVQPSRGRYAAARAEVAQ